MSSNLVSCQVVATNHPGGSSHTWANKSQAQSSNAYHSLVVDGPKIGTRNGIYFKLGSDGRYALGYKRFLEIVMKKL